MGEVAMTDRSVPAGRGPSVIIVGAGFSGLGAAIRLREAGVRDPVILERSSRVGGTWRDNIYPGAACDIPAHLYSFSFAPRADWTTVYPAQWEIQRYLESLVDEHDLRGLIAFDQEVTEAAYEPAEARWRVTTGDGRRRTADVLLMCGGPLSNPRIPDLPGVGAFAGPAFHTATWDHDVDLAGRRVGIVGTGASAIQVVPRIVDRVGSLHVFQRTPPWVIPQWNRSFSGVERWAFRSVPGLRAAFRQGVYWQKEVRVLGFKRDHLMMRLMESYAAWHMRRAVTDPALRAKLAPDYRMGCKRILLSNEYYPALTRGHVEVVDEPVEAVTPAGVRAGGRDVDLDVLVYATGFLVGEPLGRTTVVGADGRRLADVWRARISAYNGTTVPGFPNLFILLGPNTGLGHNSMVHMMESQYAYILDAVSRLRDPDVAAFDVRPEALTRWEREMERRTRRTVWASGCSSWYLGDDGRNFTLWPGPTYEYRRRTAAFDERAYRVVRRADLPAPATARRVG